MSLNPLVWIGLAGIAPDDNPRALWWQQRLHWTMVAVALLAVPAYLIDTANILPQLHPLAVVLDVFIFCAFLAETLWMMHVSDHPGRYLADNWLNVAILAGSAASMLGASTEWIAIVRLARVAIVSLVMLRAVGQFRVLFTRHGAPKLVGVTVLAVAMTGALLYWLEPTINSYWDGVWLAFVTATTIGYGDFVATTPSSRLVTVIVAVIGFAIIALFTANVVAYFIGRDASDALGGLRDDIAKLREDVGQLIRDGERMRNESPNADLEALRRDVADIATRLTALSEQLSAMEARDRAAADDRFEQRQTANRSR